MRKFPAQYNLTQEDVLNFTHIPKTAGMTFRTVVEDYFHGSEVCPATLDNHLAVMDPETIRTYRLFRGHLGFNNIPELMADKQIVNVTVLREPIARVISHYEYIRRMPGDPQYEAVIKMTLEEFAQNLCAGRVKKNIQAFHVAKLLQFDLERTPPPQVLALAKESLDQFAFVGLVERFQDSLFLLSYIFGWKPILNERKENVGKPKKLEELPAHTLEVIKENSLLDIELYQYAKDIFEQRFTEMQRDLIDKYAAEVVPELALTPDSPLSVDVLYRLLDRHYQQRYLDRQLTPPDTVFYDFGQPLRGSGWQRREYPENSLSSYRWIGPGTSASLDLPIAIRPNIDLVVEFRVICAEMTPPDILKNLTLAVNGNEIDLDLVHEDQGTRYFHGIIPYALVQPDRPFLELTFRVNRVTSLNATNPLNPDTRLVGVAVNYIHVFPIDTGRQQSTLLEFLECKEWQDTIAFLRQHRQPEERISAPLIFKTEFIDKVADHDAFLADEPFPWVVVHKGRNEMLTPTLLKLLQQGYSPVFANPVFVVYTQHHTLPALAYTAPHVKPLYVDRGKQMLRRIYRSKTLRLIYVKLFGFYIKRQRLQQRSRDRQLKEQRLKNKV